MIGQNPWIVWNVLIPEHGRLFSHHHSVEIGRARDLLPDERLPSFARRSTCRFNQIWHESWQLTGLLPSTDVSWRLDLISGSSALPFSPSATSPTSSQLNMPGCLVWEILLSYEKQIGYSPLWVGTFFSRDSG